jgi:hypothetical protein
MEKNTISQIKKRNHFLKKALFVLSMWREMTLGYGTNLLYFLIMWAPHRTSHWQSLEGAESPASLDKYIYIFKKAKSKKVDILQREEKLVLKDKNWKLWNYKIPSSMLVKLLRKLEWPQSPYRAVIISTLWLGSLAYTQIDKLTDCCRKNFCTQTYGANKEAKTKINKRTSKTAEVKWASCSS